MKDKFMIFKSICQMIVSLTIIVFSIMLIVNTRNTNKSIEETQKRIDSLIKVDDILYPDTTYTL